MKLLNNRVGRVACALVLSLVWLPLGCGPETEIEATGPGEEVGFVEPLTALYVIGDGYRLVVTGKRADNSFGCQINVEFAGTLVDDLQEDSLFTIDGTAVVTGGDVEFSRRAAHSNDLGKVWIGAVCSECDDSLDLEQTLSGTLGFDTRDDEEIVGTLTLTSLGSMPGWNDDQPHEVDARFEIVWVAEIVEPGETTGGDDPDPGIHSVSLGPDTGVVFSTHTKTKPGNFQNSDLYATAGGSHLKLTPGGSKPTQSNAVNWFPGAGGFHSTFAALSQVPTKYQEDDSGISLINAKAGIGFVIKNNLSDGYTRGWIREGGTQVTIEYEVIP